MNWQRIQRQITRDVKASPKKAAALGLLAVVGLYFWAPLIWGWFNPKPKTTAKTTTTASKAVTPVAANDASAPAPAAEPAIAWQKLNRWIAEDPNSKPAMQLTTQRDPFATEILLGDHPPEPAAGEADVKENVTPDSEGLEVTMTLIGDRRRSAVISGHLYTEGETIETESGVLFVLASVEPRRVVLQRDGQQYELSIKDPGSTGGVRLKRSKR